MLERFQETIANDINRIANPYGKYAAWAGYWMVHGVAVGITLGFKLFFWIAGVAAAIVLPAPRAKKKKGH